MTQYHVSASAGSPAGIGSEADPFLTIGQAAAIARAGDEVIVHAGTYRESVDPRFGGESETNRIVYRAAEGEPRPVITGAERIDTWVPESGGVWRAEIPNSFFGGYNPYVETVFGDWTVYPDPKVEVRHLGDVYLNGKSFYEVASLDKVREPERWDTGRDAATDSIVPLLDPDATVNVWYCETDAETTTIWANFHDADPNVEVTEINVRETCFYPSRPFVNYVTVRGFELCRAACPYTPPTADQVGLIGPHWSRGWVIEGNVIHDAKCSAISLGKEISTGDNDSTRTHRKSGYQYQKEAVYKALHVGWRKGVVGGHVVRGNVIYDCGQNGVVGHMGCAFSLIEGNHIFRIGTKREFFGWEVAAIKMHAAVDTVVRGNRVHDSVLGMWLDWQAQGTVVDANVFYRNTRDVMTEVTHGPITFTNNVFASEFSFDDYAQGAAFVNNLFAGRIRHTQVLDRSTPYHFPHSTDPAGEAFVYGGDDRYLNNLFMAVGGAGEAERMADAAGGEGVADTGTACFEDHPHSLADYERRIEEAGLGDEELYRSIPQPMTLASNTYLNGARAASWEPDAVVCGEAGALSLRETDDELWLTVTLPEAVRGATGPVVSTADLGQPRIVEGYFEQPDGSPIVVDRDITGAARGERSARGPLAAYPADEVLVWRSGAAS
ncbi:right-handed parallel beta-helix repeat-containing protein [Bifidobacterium miconisargentati]|uniref:right-handed parallel beta-helix repeat-containing protein n=1 Tax=Bifidobacterium miconisargentati TaxID=2834437 RepID=UPI001BDD0165|nr:right-handed parallel beta-helix repeat-containing protein [Bifidobacterium miconisargentati]MBW3089391.1 right-handed parallel beta-helix repeat-containing protein [Bifidobacterium miconisargentati]